MDSSSPVPMITSSPGRRQQHPFARPEGRIREALQVDKHTKWGYLFYRCDYTDDAAWDKFMSNIYSVIAEGLELLEAQDLQPALEMTVKKDRDTLDGATVDQVRELFGEWVKSDEAKNENNNTPDWKLSQYPRYTYCVYVDADAIDSVVRRAPQPPEFDSKQLGYVTLVSLGLDDKLIEEAMASSSYVTEDEDDYDEDEDFTKMNHAKVPVGYLGAEGYCDLAREWGDSTWYQIRKYRRWDGVSCGRSSLSFLPSMNP